MLSYVPAGVPLYTEFSNFSREWGTARPDLRTTPYFESLLLLSGSFHSYRYMGIWTILSTRLVDRQSLTYIM